MNTSHLYKHNRSKCNPVNERYILRVGVDIVFDRKKYQDDGDLNNYNKAQIGKKKRRSHI